MSTPILDTTFPGAGRLRAASKNDLKRGLGECVGCALASAIRKADDLVAVNVSSVSDAALLQRLDRETWTFHAVPNDVLFSLIQEAAAVVVGASLPLDQAQDALHWLLNSFNGLVHRFPSADLLHFDERRRLRAYRTDGTPRIDGLDSDWADVHPMTGLYVPNGPMDHPVRRAIDDLNAQHDERLLNPSFLGAILVAGEAKVLRGTAEAVIEGAPIAAPVRRRL
ncbi:hypothetical protein [Burkholderia vietnamiensis]|uniref:hypothetical protein n=1 Tax=Burkholderia vietnamiensis TaxID=60552 RepID=UPI001594358A|nr:hypothetical protein [Burkholderia vietnamiensis]